MSDYDIVIVGGGINGMTAACAFHCHGFKVALIEKSHISKKLTTTRDGRGLSIARHSKDILLKYGIWEHISHNAGEMHKIVVQDTDSKPTLKFDNDLVGGETLGFLIESDDVLKGLYKKIQGSDVELIDGQGCKAVNFTSTDAEVTLDNDQVLRTSLVVATDGKNSGMRAMLGMGCNKKDYHQTALVFNVSHKEKHNNYAYEIFLKNGPFALLPLQNQNHSSVVWCDNSGVAKEEINKEEFEKFLQDRCSEFYSDVRIITDITKFPLSLSYMNEYYKDRAVFIGDSLHFIHPVAGQGYNLSLRDIDTLADLTIKYKNLGFDIGAQQVLKDFQNRRKRDNKVMMHATDGISELFSNDKSVLRLFRKTGIGIVDNIPPLKKFFMRKAMGH